MCTAISDENVRFISFARNLLFFYNRTDNFVRPNRHTKSKRIFYCFVRFRRDVVDHGRFHIPFAAVKLFLHQGYSDQFVHRQRADVGVGVFPDLPVSLVNTKSERLHINIIRTI